MHRYLFILILFFSTYSFAKQKPHWFGIERGLMDGFSLHFAPEGFDIGLSYGMMPAVTHSVNTHWNGSSWDSTEAKSEFTQLGVRLGVYTEYYGEDSFYFNIFTGQMQVKQKRTGGGLADRSADVKASFAAGGLGYHWFWENFNLRF